MVKRAKLNSVDCRLVAITIDHRLLDASVLFQETTDPDSRTGHWFIPADSYPYIYTFHVKKKN